MAQIKGKGWAMHTLSIQDFKNVGPFLDVASIHAHEIFEKTEMRQQEAAYGLWHVSGPTSTSCGPLHHMR